MSCRGLASCRSSFRLLTFYLVSFSYPFSFAFRIIDISVEIVCDAPSILNFLKGRDDRSFTPQQNKLNMGRQFNSVINKKFYKNI